jgi:hypothetical protein
MLVPSMQKKEKHRLCRFQTLIACGFPEDNTTLHGVRNPDTAPNTWFQRMNYPMNL